MSVLRKLMLQRAKQPARVVPMDADAAEAAFQREGSHNAAMAPQIEPQSRIEEDFSAQYASQG